MVLFIRSLFIQLFLNAYFVYRIGKNKRINPFLKYLLYSLIGLETLVYFTGLFAREYLPIEYSAFIHKINAFWIIFSIYFLGLLFVFDLIFYLNKKWVFYIKLKYKALICIDIIVFATFFTLIKFHFHSSKDNYIESQIVDYSFRFQSPVPDSAQTKTKYKLVLVSDIHLGYLIDKKVLQKYVNILNAQQADILIINGDLIDYYLEPLIAQNVENDLKQLYAPQGVYFVPGNHEYKIDVEACLEWIRKAGISVLRDSVVTIDNQLQLIGRDDRKNKGNRMEWDKLMAQSDPTRARILITHQPGDIKEVSEYNLPLILCGHTHRGQIFPVNLIGFLLFHNPYGLQKESASSYSYTTAGLGLSGFPFRIGNESEIAIFNIEFY
jgi:predicted MPP superfamily phosphohydrolase